jgi:short-subunit dehydrogenase
MTFKQKQLRDQVLVITGASSGIGLATALLAAQAGAKVVLIARSGRTLHRIAIQVVRLGGEALCCTADVSCREDVERAAEATIARFGCIDTWVNNAAVSIYGRLEEVNGKDSRQLFETNYWGVVYGSLAALPHLKRQGGTLINMGSEASDAAIPLQGMYTASKHAVKGFTDVLRVELQSEQANVAVTLVQPGAVDTPLSEHAANYLPHEPALPPPLVAPERVALTILDAATRPTRHVRIGAVSVVNSTVARLLPRMADRIARLQISRQESEQPAQYRSGALYGPCETGRIHGEAPSEPMAMEPPARAAQGKR